MRLIDADKLKEAFPARHNNKFVLIADVRAAINQASEVDAVPVIRCRDCRYWEREKPFATSGRCFIWECTERKGSDYCSEAREVKE